jgi:hypothetical protein
VSPKRRGGSLTPSLALFAVALFVFALKGPNNLAQGIALGWPVPMQPMALKGPNNLAQGIALGWPVPRKRSP